jgi:hypothetical protein
VAEDVETGSLPPLLHAQAKADVAIRRALSALADWLWYFTVVLQAIARERRAKARK